MLTTIAASEPQLLPALYDTERPSPLPFRFELGQKVLISEYHVEVIVLGRTYTWLGRELYTIQTNDDHPAPHVRVVLGDVLTAA